MRAVGRTWRTLAFTGAGVLALALSVPVGVLAAGGQAAPSSSASAGNSNQEDVWVDNVGQPAGPGHEMDPHLACENINLWGVNLADATGIYTVDGWAPSGSGSGDYGHPGYKQDQAWPGTKANPSTATWTYSLTSGGDQVLSVINVQTLIAHAIANGDLPVNGQGFHFKLQFVQDPQKHKTFWVNCPGPSPSTSPSPSPSASPSSSPSSSPSTSPSPSPSPSTSPSPSSSPSTSPSPSPSTSPTSEGPSVTVVKTNDADGSGTYSQSEQATSAGQSVSFHALISNDSQAAESISTITDTYSGTTVSECSSLIGTMLAPGASVLCTFTIAGYSPAAGASLIDTVKVAVTHDGASAAAEGTSTVTTPAGGVLGASTTTPGTGAALEVGITIALMILGLTLLGLGRWVRRQPIG